MIVEVIELVDGEEQTHTYTDITSIIEVPGALLLNNPYDAIQMGQESHCIPVDEKEGRAVAVKVVIA